MIWWLWTAFNPPRVHRFDVNDAWWDAPDVGRPHESEVSWLGECAWTARADLMGIGLR